MDTENLDISEKIEGVLYVASKIAPKPIWTIRLKLIKLVGPSILERAEKLIAVGNEQDGSTKQTEQVLSLVSEIIKETDPQEVMDFLEEVCGHVLMDGKKISELGFDTAFHDKPDTMPWRIAFMFLKVNFRDFLPERIQTVIKSASSKVQEKGGLDALVKSKLEG